MTADQKAREAGLYVDWRDGHVVAPEDAVTPKSVLDLLAVFTQVIYRWAESFRGVDFSQMFTERNRKPQSCNKPSQPATLRSS